MQTNAKSLILNLLNAAHGQPLQARDGITAAALFGISANSVRVALARLSAEALIEAAGRGSYQLGPMAMELYGDVASWRHAQQRLRPWHGDYLAVFSAGLGRTDRMALRRRERALQLLGFRPLEKGLHVRPNNIQADVPAVRQRLDKLGLEPQARLFVASAFDRANEAQIHALWDGPALTASYQHLDQQLTDWLQRAPQLELEVAAREAFLLGNKAIRQVVFDPLLPDPLVDTVARQNFIAGVQRFDQAGQQIWKRLFAGSSPAESIRSTGAQP